MKNDIAVLIPQVPGASQILSYLLQIDENKIYSNFGPLNSQLKHRLASYCGVDKTLIATCSNATLAIQGLLETDVADSSEWSVPVWTFTATASASIKSGRNVSFVDAKEDWRPNFITRNPSGSILDVAPFGDSIDLDSIIACKSMVIDAAPSFDAVQQISLHNKFPIAIVVSMHATKLLPAGEGAFVISNCHDWITKFEAWTNFGMDSQRQSQFVGTNAKLSEYAAAVALASLDNWNATRTSMLKLGTRLKKLTEDFGFEVAPAMKRGLATPYWIVDLKSPERKNKLVELCNDHSIGWRNWWNQGIHHMPAYSKLTLGNFEVCDSISARTLGLPFHFKLTEEEIARIESVLSQI